MFEVDVEGGFTRHVITGWELTQPDGGGRDTQVMGIVRDEAVAKEWVAKAGSWPRGYRPFYREFLIAHSLEALDNINIEKRKAAALAKLTPGERKLLGL